MMKTKNKRLIIIMLIAACLLLLPLIAMQFDTGVDWKMPDFIVGGVLLFGAGLACELALRRVTKPFHRIVVCVALLAALFLIWAELAVGIFGTPFAGS